jgi:hypothetical protein
MKILVAVLTFLFVGEVNCVAVSDAGRKAVLFANNKIEIRDSAGNLLDTIRSKQQDMGVVQKNTKGHKYKAKVSKSEVLYTSGNGQYIAVCENEVEDAFYINGQWVEEKYDMVATSKLILMDNNKTKLWEYQFDDGFVCGVKAISDNGEVVLCDVGNTKWCPGDKDEHYVLLNKQGNICLSFPSKEVPLCPISFFSVILSPNGKYLVFMIYEKERNFTCFINTTNKKYWNMGKYVRVYEISSDGIAILGKQTREELRPKLDLKQYIGD